jgi:hypothetical protein
LHCSVCERCADYWKRWRIDQSWTTTVLGGVIVPTSGGLTVDGSGNLSVNWGSPGSIGSTTPSMGTFSNLSDSGYLVVGSPIGGQQGAGSINAQSIYINGQQLSTTSNYNAASVAITGSTINGVTIGGSTAEPGSFTTLAASGAVTLGSSSTLKVGSATGTPSGSG